MLACAVIPCKVFVLYLGVKLCTHIIAFSCVDALCFVPSICENTQYLIVLRLDRWFEAEYEF